MEVMPANPLVTHQCQSELDHLTCGSLCRGKEHLGKDSGSSLPISFREAQAYRISRESGFVRNETPSLRLRKEKQLATARASDSETRDRKQ